MRFLKSNIATHYLKGLIAAALLILHVPPNFAQPTEPPGGTPVHSAPNTDTANPQRIKVLVLGDSLSAEYGLVRGTGWVSLLERKLQESASVSQHGATQLQELPTKGGPHEVPSPPAVVNASMSGDTTAGGRSRILPLLAKYRPEVLIIELGANDALRGMPLSASKANLDSITETGLKFKCKVLLIGNLMPSNYGEQINADLSKMYRLVSDQHHVALVPFMLKGVADAPNASALFQSDQLHPLAAAHPTILNNIWPTLKRLL